MAQQPKKIHESEETTTWINPSDKPVVLRLLQANGRYMDLKKSTIQPGEGLRLSSVYDDAIRRVDPKTGYIVSGKCPWLLKAGEENIKLHPSLDFKAIIEEQELAREAEKIRKDESYAKAIVRRAERAAKLSE